MGTPFFFLSNRKTPQEGTQGWVQNTREVQDMTLIMLKTGYQQLKNVSKKIGSFATDKKIFPGTAGFTGDRTLNTRISSMRIKFER